MLSYHLKYYQWEGRGDRVVDPDTRLPLCLKQRQEFGKQPGAGKTTLPTQPVRGWLSTSTSERFLEHLKCFLTILVAWSKHSRREKRQEDRAHHTKAGPVSTS